MIDSTLLRGLGAFRRGGGGRIRGGVGSRRRLNAFLGYLLNPFVQNTYGAVFPNPVAHLPGINPHGELCREERPQERHCQSHHETCPGNQRVHLAVDSDAAVTGSLERLVREPMVSVMPLQDFGNIALKPFQLFLRQ